MVFVTRHFLGQLLDLLGDRSLARRLSPERLRDTSIFTDKAEIEFLEARVRSWLSTRTRAQVMEEAQRARVPVTAVLQFEEVLRDPHFRYRGMFHELDHPIAGALEYVGPPWRMENGWRLQRPAPLLGQHTEQVLAEIGVGGQELALLRATEVA
jgi:crotonobetainyl-CoA:carnitine CoA-transferase CaiB-like acyl-CoA transferase